MISARRAFLQLLIDDAGLFPPAALPPAEALAVDRLERTGSHAWMLGNFVVPAAQLAKLAGVLEPLEAALGLSLIVGATHLAQEIDEAVVLQRAAPERIAIRSIETKTPAVDDGEIRSAVSLLVANVDATSLPRGTPVYIEIAFGERWESRVAATIDALADVRARSPHDIAGKLRCGGPTASLVPSPEQLAFAIGTLRAREVPFKATAGLHHPVRHDDPVAGYAVHGFLNVIGAAVLDWNLDLDDRARRNILDERDATRFTLDDAVFAWNDLAVGPAQVAAAREQFVRSYGSCSFSEPVEDLIGLGVLETAVAR